MRTNSFIKELAPIDNRSKIKQKKNEQPEYKKGLNIESAECDIVYIDEDIKKNLVSKRNILDSLKIELGTMKWIINNSADRLDIMQAIEESDNLRKKIQDIELGFEYSLYILRTADIISEYKILTDVTKSVSFIKTFATRDETKIHKRNKLILDYFRIAKEYTDLQNYKQKITKPVCDSCHSTTFTYTGEGDFLLVCECGNTMEQLDDAPTFKDAERVNMSSRYTYTCRGHFVEAMNRFEGKQNTEINVDVIEMLKKEVRLHRLTSETATKDQIYMFMTEKKLSEYYADINLIYFKITNKNPPDITEFRNELLEMHDQIEEAYMEVKDADRLNSLNVNWKLYKLLQLLGYTCKKDDFFCLKTPTKQWEHEQTWHSMIEYLAEKYPVAVTSYGAKRWRHVKIP